MSRNDELSQLVAQLGVHQPTPEQAEVITYPLRLDREGESVATPLLVVAGAGSGKTETMSLRAVYLAATQGIPDDAILGLTFTRKAAAELAARLSDRLAQLRLEAGSDLGALEFESSPTATTYDSFALDVVREFGPQLGIPTDFSHLGAAASWQLMYSIIEEWPTRISEGRELSTITTAALELRDAIANQAMTLAEARRELERIDHRFNAREHDEGAPKFTQPLAAGRDLNRERLALLPVIEAFEERKREERRLDFSDQVLLATRIVEHLPTARAELRDRHQVVFLDEFQDTSVAQLRFLSALFADHPVTAVGDPNQAIYGWRGASAASLNDFHRYFTQDRRAPRGTLSLSTAWRNSTLILDVANRVAQDLARPPSWLESATMREELVFSPTLQPRPEAPTGEVTLRYRQTETESIQDVVEFLRDTYRQAEKNGLPRPTAAVLCRNRRLMAPVLEACRAAEIPAETGGDDGLLLHPAVLDVRAALEICHDLGRSSQIMRLLTNLDLGSKDLWALSRLAKQLARRAKPKNSEQPDRREVPLLIDAVDYLSGPQAQRLDLSEAEQISAIGRERIVRLGRQLRAMRRAADWPIVDQVENARRILQLDEQAFALGDLAGLTEVLDAFTRAAQDYVDSAVQPTMGGFLSWLSAANQFERGLPLPTVQPNPEAVQVLTIHGAKGLEWDTVAIVGMQSGHFPGGQAGKLDDQPDGSVKATPPPMPPTVSGWWQNLGELPYPARRDHEHLPNPDAWAGDEAFTKVFTEFKTCLGEYQLAEDRRLAYVALTRAKTRMFLTGAWYHGAKTRRYPSLFYQESEEVPGVDSRRDNPPTEVQVQEFMQVETEAVFPIQPGPLRKRVSLSAAKVEEQLALLSGGSGWRPADLLASLPDQELATSMQVLLREHEDRQALRRLSRSERARREVKLAAAGDRAFSATELARLDLVEDPWVELRRPLPARPMPAAAIGTAFHQWVESVLRRASARASEEEPGQDLLPLGGADQDLGADAVLDPEQRQVLGELQSQFTGLEWLGRLRVEGVEVPFDLDLGGLLVRGRVDAVFTDPDDSSSWLVDWKTGRIPDLYRVEAIDRAEIIRYLVQLEVYTAAWQRRHGPEHPVQAALVFVRPERTEMIKLDQLRAAHRQWAGSPLSVEEIARRWKRELSSD